ncbi:MAG: glycosyltransferase family 2 protein [Micrococcales bacterium]|nr:glycosyltransferase family 2 protein [Micrococcales bacterium]
MASDSLLDGDEPTEAWSREHLVLAEATASEADGPAVTVVVPAFDVAPFVVRCLESVRAQTLADLECLIVEDCSTDDTLAVVEHWLATTGDRRFRLVRQPSNQGVALARNTALREARGRYVAFVDSDDWFDPDFLAVLHERAETTGADVVGSGWRRPGPDGKIHQRVSPRGKNRYYVFQIGAVWAKLHRTDFLRRHQIEFYTDNTYAEDLSFGAHELVHTDRIELVDYVGYNYFLNETSVSFQSHPRFGHQGRDPIVFLEHLLALESRPGTVAFDRELFRYFSYRVFFSFVLLCGRGWTPAQLLDLIRRFDTFMLKAYGPTALWRNRYLPWGGPDEPLVGRTMIAGVWLLRRLGLMPVFARLYCRARPADHVQDEATTIPATAVGR